MIVFTEDQITQIKNHAVIMSNRMDCTFNEAVYHICNAIIGYNNEPPNRAK